MKLKGFIHQKGVRDYILIDENVIERDGDEPTHTVVYSMIVSGR